MLYMSTIIHEANLSPITSRFEPRDERVAAYKTGQQNQQWRIRQLTDSCINIILPSRIAVILFYFRASDFNPMRDPDMPRYPEDASAYQK